ncbi:MAG: hypothetical protein RR619_09750, partial [Raoultibacter sp.]
MSSVKTSNLVCRKRKTEILHRKSVFRKGSYKTLHFAHQHYLLAIFSRVQDVVGLKPAFNGTR